MSLSGQWLVIGSVILLCSCASSANLRKRRQSDFVFPDYFDGFASRGGGGHHNHFSNHFQQQPNPQQQLFQPQNGQGGLFQQSSRVPFPTPILPGPPANINSPQEASTVVPDMTLTTPSPAFFACMSTCPTTSEYNPICGTNRQLYFNQQKFDCAVRCGAQVQIWRRGSCEGLFPMMRG